MTAPTDETKSTIRFEIAPPPPFRLDLTVWALRRRPGNIVDRWDGTTYRRAIPVSGEIADISVTQVRPPESPRLNVAVTTSARSRRDALRAETTVTLGRMLGLEVDLGRFYRLARRDPDLRQLTDCIHAIERIQGVFSVERV